MSLRFNSFELLGIHGVLCVFQKNTSGRLGLPELMEGVGSLRTPMDLPPRFHRISGTKKDALGRLPLDLVGRGNLNGSSNLLIYLVKFVFYFCLEYQLEYRSVENCFTEDYSGFPVE